jgi:rhodanese-related sulfurtransferase
MKRVGLGLLVALAVTGCSKGGGGAAATVESISPEQANALVQKGAAILVDVREEEEVKAGMAAPARWMSLSSIKADESAFKAMLAGVPADQPVIFYCASGGRSGKAAQRAAELGHRAANMGGYSAWAGAGLPTKKP